MKKEVKDVVLDHDDMESAVAVKAVALVKGQAENVSMQVQSRLQQARDQAVASLAKHDRATATTLSGHGLILSGLTPYLRQPKTLFIALVLVLLTLVSVQQYSHQQQLENSDASLLAADLPPEAFADKDFNQWVELAGR